MSDLSSAQKAGRVHGPTLDRYRSFVPLALLLYWIQMETGWFRLAVSIDKKLIESGWPQTPLARAWTLNCDPFDAIGGLWLACIETLSDAAHWRPGDDCDDPVRREIGEWLTHNDRNLWWVVQMDYSVGTGALRHILACAIARAKNLNRGPADLGLMVEAIDWAAVTNLAEPVHARHWGRQSPAQIGARILKHRDWIVEAAKLGPLDDAPPGGLPPLARPAGVPCFPLELVPQAKVCARQSMPEERERAWAAVRAYARARAKREITTRARIAYRIRTWLGREEAREPVERPA